MLPTVVHCITKEREGGKNNKKSIHKPTKKYNKRFSNWSQVLTWICTSSSHLKVTHWKIMQASKLTVRLLTFHILKRRLFLQERFSEVIYSALSKNFYQPLSTKRSDRLLMRHYSKTEITPEDHVICRCTLAPFWVPPVFHFLGLYLCQFSYIQPTLLWHSHQVHAKVFRHEFLYFVGIISGIQWITSLKNSVILETACSILILHRNLIILKTESLQLNFIFYLVF